MGLNRLSANGQPNATQGMLNPNSMQTPPSSEADLLKEFTQMLDKIVVAINNSNSVIEASIQAPTPIQRVEAPKKQEKQDHSSEESSHSAKAATNEQAASSESEEKGEQEESVAALEGNGTDDAEHAVENSDESAPTTTQLEEAVVVSVKDTNAPKVEITDQENSTGEETATQVPTLEGEQLNAQAMPDKMAAPVPDSAKPAASPETQGLDQNPIVAPAANQASEVSATPESDPVFKLGEHLKERIAKLDNGANVERAPFSMPENALAGFQRELANHPLLNGEILLSRAMPDFKHFKDAGSARANNPVQTGITPATSLSKSSETSHERSSTAPKTLSRPDAQRTLEKVQDAIKEVAKSKDGKTISVRLDPPNLGTVKIDVTYKEGVLHARVVAELQQVASLLRERAHELQSLLRKVGLDAQQVSVSVGTGQGNQEGSSADSAPRRETRQPHVNVDSDVLGQGDSGGTTGLPQGSWESTIDHWVA